MADAGREALELETRKRIFDFVSQNPGIHFREMSRQLGIPTGVIEYHLRYMQSREMVAAKKDGRYTRYYVVGRMGAADKSKMSILRLSVPRKIVMHLLIHPGATHGDLLAILPISSSTLTFHLKRLVSEGILREEKSGRNKHFTVADPEAMGRALVEYRESFADSLVDGFVRTWEDLHA